MTDVIYTAIFGSIDDKLRPAQNQSGDTELVAFIDATCVHVPTDEIWDNTKMTNVIDLAAGDYTSDCIIEGWRLAQPVFHIEETDRRKARRHKLLPHRVFPRAEYSLWVDGCLAPLTNMQDLIDEYLEHTDICVFAHMQRDCVYDELQACCKLKKDDPTIMTHQIDRYLMEGYPRNNGLAETTAVLRRHSPQMNEINEMWFDELSKNSVRDQLSLDYVLWVKETGYSTFRGTRTNSPHFSWRPHR